MSATDTMYAESAQALFCAIADIVGKQKTKKILDLNLYPSYYEFKKSNKKLINDAYLFVDTPGATLKGIEGFLERPSDKNEWYRSSSLIAIKLMDDLQTFMSNFGYTKFNKFQSPKINNLVYKRGDDTIMGRIEQLWKIANNNKKYWQTLGQVSFGDVNKWSPADMYFASVSGQKSAEQVISREVTRANQNPSAYNIDALNTMMDGLINTGDLFPLSLKKAPKEVKLQAVNFTDKIKAGILRNIVYKDIYGIERKGKAVGLTGWQADKGPPNAMPKNLKTWYSKKEPQRDMVIGINDSNGSQKGNIQIRHDPSGGGGGGWKVDFKYRGGGSRGGSLVSQKLFGNILILYDNKGGAKFLSEYNMAVKIFSDYNKTQLEPNKAKIKKALGGDKPFNEMRGEASGRILINRVMPIIAASLSSMNQDTKNAFVRHIFQYVTSRSLKSGKFVIAKD